MNITAIKSMLSSKATIEKIRKAIFNTSKLNWSCDHVSNRKGKNFLAFRVRGGKLQITTKKGLDITQDIVKVLKGSL